MGESNIEAELITHLDLFKRVPLPTHSPLSSSSLLLLLSLKTVTKNDTKMLMFEKQISNFKEIILHLSGKMMRTFHDE